MAKRKTKFGKSGGKQPYKPQPIALHGMSLSAGSPVFESVGLNDREFEAIILRARSHFREIYSKPNAFPKKSDLVAFFKSQRLSDGSPISNHLAEALATIARPARLMKGGNTKG